MEASARPRQHSLAIDHLPSSLNRSQSAAVAPRFPNGACNFHHPGNSAQTCGCRRFWLNDIVKSSANEETEAGTPISAGAWCFCGHHACFHALDEQAHFHRETESVEAVNTYSSQSRVVARDISAPYLQREIATSDFSRVPAQASGARPIPCGLSTNLKEEHVVNSSSSSVPNRPGSRTQKYPTYSYSPVPNKNHLDKRLYSSFGGQPSRMYNSIELGSQSMGANWDVSAQPNWHARPTQAAPTFFARPQSRHQSASENSNEFIATQPREKPPSFRGHQTPPTRTFPYTAHSLALSPTEVASPRSYAGTPLRRGSQSNGVPLLSPTSAIRLTLADNSKDYLSPTQINSCSSHSALGTPHLTDIEKANQQSSTVDFILSQIVALKSLLPADPNLSATLSALRHRLDALECVAFGRGPDDELQDMVDLLEGRMIDSEEKIEDLERFRAGHAATSPSLKGLSFQGTSSFLICDGRDPSSRLSPLANLSQETALNRIEEFEQRLEILESAALPTTTNPWEIEVVLLPWGRNLRGIWFVPDDSNDAAVATDEASNFGIFIESRASHIKPKSSDRSSRVPLGRVSEDCGSNSNLWLAPRACGPTKGSGGKVFERLRTRGLVRNVILHHNSAREVQEEIYMSFADIFGRLELSRSMLRASSSTYLGLLGPFTPLRKVHKSSRLRFLSAAELTTPSLWTAEFLNSSVFMKAPSAGLRRLFITQPTAYFQHASLRTSNETTWSHIHDLPRFNALLTSSDEEMAERDENDCRGEMSLNEPCWHVDDRLDPLTVQKSFSGAVISGPDGSFQSLPSPTSEQEGLDYSSEDEDIDVDVASDVSSMEDVYLATTPTSLYSARQFRRTISNPMTAQEVDQVVTVQTITKRHAPNSQAADSKPDLISKRPRVSQRTMSVDTNTPRQTRWTLTPRLSHEPSSPASHTPNPISQGTHRSIRTYGPAGIIKRAPTPSAYATPYSNNFTFNGLDHFQAGGDTDMDESDDELAGPSTQFTHRRPTGQQNVSDDDDIWTNVVEEAHQQMQESDQDDEHEEEDVAVEDSNEDDDVDSHEDEQIFEDWARGRADDDDDDEDDDENMDEEDAEYL